MASNLRVMASNLVAVASNLSGGPQAKSDGRQPSSDGLQNKIDYITIYVLSKKPLRALPGLTNMPTRMDRGTLGSV